jgi:putrescine transport system permease protein
MARRRWYSPLMLGLLLAVLYAPLLYLVAASVNSDPSSTGWGGLTLRWYRGALDDPEVADAARVSIRLALLSAVAATLVATCAIVAVRRRPLLGRLHAAFVTGRVATPEIIIGLGALLPAAGLSLGFWPMALAHTAYLAAFAAVIIGARAGGADVSLEEAAIDLGARPLQVVRTIVLPDLLPAIASAFLVCAAFSFDDVALSLALRGPQDTTLPVLLFSRMQRRFTPSIHAVGTIVLAVGVVAFAAAFTVNRAVLGAQNTKDSN